MSNLKYDVFLSHSSGDKPWVEALARKLREEDIRPFLDKWHLIPGEPWQEALERALMEESACCVVVVGREGVSPWEAEEQWTALTRSRMRDQRFPVFAVLLPGVEASQVPPFLANRTWVEFTTPDDPEAFHRLLCGIRGKAPEPDFEDEQTRGLSLLLEDAYRRRAELESRGEDATKIRDEILGYKRQLREGGHLKAGDSLLSGRFQLLEEIGRGGFATVWKAWDGQHREFVAVKVLHGQFAKDQTRLQRFFRGAEQMARLHHPGIVRVIERKCRDGSFHFFVMEYLAGGDLQEAVFAGRVGKEEGLGLIRKLGEALHFAHEQGVIHRDVKPANILLDLAGRPKLTDFDLVRAADTTGGTRTGMMGTFIYASPEAMDQPQHTDHRTDLYGLGMTMAFVVYGERLPSHQVFFKRDAFLAQLEASEAVREAVRRAIAPDPEDRFPDVMAFLEALVVEPVEPTTEPPVQEVPSVQEPATEAQQPRAPSLEALRAIVQEWGIQPDLPADPDERAKVFQRLPELVGDGDRALKLIDRLRQGTRNGDDLFFLDVPVRQVAQRWPEQAEAAEQLLARFFDHIPAPDPALFQWVETPKDGKVLLWREIQVGSFLMGSPEDEEDSYDDERPQHEVTILNSFGMAAVPVTNQQYRAFDPAHRWEPWDGVTDEDLFHHPVANVSWWAAVSFCRWLASVVPGLEGARLATEAEWEYACRAGTQTPYWSGSSEKDLAKVGWYDENSGNRTHRVGEKPANAFGLYDVHGNVWEWTISPWSSDYSGREAGIQHDPRQAEGTSAADLAAASGEDRVVRGGGIRDSADWARSACRNWWFPRFRNGGLGFRVVVPVAPEFGLGQ
jgi:formylglycine-generating enzyme required for sulfatase activity/serine/threonine protein kinase